MTLPSTAYETHPWQTDSEYDQILQRNAQLKDENSRLNQLLTRYQEGNADLLRNKIALERTLDALNAHIEADHEFLKYSLGNKGLVRAHNPHTRGKTALPDRDEANPVEQELVISFPEEALFTPTTRARRVTEPRTIDSL